MNYMLFILFLLIAGHALGDFALQNQYVSDAKNRNTEHGKEVWWMVLTSHALIHGGIVALITSSVTLGIFETIAHWITDFAKCEKLIDYKTDQFLHISHKFIWFIIIIASGGFQPA